VPSDAVADITLAYSVRGKPKSRLFPPAVVAPVLARPVNVTLVPSRLPVPMSVLRQPTVVQAFRIPVVQVHLVRIRPVAVHVLLGKPTDLVDRQDLGFVKVHLAPSRFPKPMSRLSPPTVVFTGPTAPITVSLVRRPTPTVVSRLLPPAVTAVPRAQHEAPIVFARIRPPRVHSLLKPPSVVAIRENIQTATTFVTITPPRVHSRLKPPTVVGAGIVFRPILTHLAYSSRGKPMWLLTPMGEGKQCYGTVTGFDFAPSVCGSDDGATVVGSTSSSMSVTGSDAGATATGTSAASGTVTGGDTKREGC
jgi:hypothetical protein